MLRSRSDFSSRGCGPSSDACVFRCLFFTPVTDNELRQLSERLGEGPAATLGRPGPGAGGAPGAPGAPGAITWTNLREWWDANIADAKDVAVLASEEAFEKAVLAEPATTVVCLEVSSTFCRPCKAFEPVFKRVAKEYTPKGARFLRADGAFLRCSFRCGREHRRNRTFR